MICSVCKQEKVESEFRTQKKGKKLYLLGKCRSCEKEYGKYYRHNVIGIDTYNEKNRKWKTEHKEKMRGYEKTYKAKHPDFVERLRQKSRERFRTEKGRNVARINQQNRRSAKLNNGGTFSSSEWESVLKKYNYTCLCCKRTDVKLSIDHVVPLKLGGKHSIENIQPLCRSCNSKKHLQIFDYREGVQYEN